MQQLTKPVVSRHPLAHRILLPKQCYVSTRLAIRRPSRAIGSPSPLIATTHRSIRIGATRNASARRSVLTRSATVSSTPTQAMSSATDVGPASLIQVFSNEGTNTALEVELSFMGDDGYAVGSPVDLSTFKRVPWTQGSNGKSELKGVIYEGMAKVPAGARTEMVLMKIKAGAKADKEFVNKISIKTDGAGYFSEFAPNTWVHKLQGQRIVFSSTAAYLPHETPAVLKKWREAELQELRGAKLAEVATMRQEWDRIYDYDVYNDLAGVDKATGKLADRNVLGASKEYPYPRRLRTGRAKIPGPGGKVYETRETPDGQFWLPLDEAFSSMKKSQFKVYSMLGLVSTMSEMLRRKIFDKDGVVTDFAEYDKIFAKMSDPRVNVSDEEVVEEMKKDPSNSGFKIFGFGVNDIKLLTPVLSAVSSTVSSVKEMSGSIKGLLNFPPPLVWSKRERVWMDDEEWGRQVLAGVNPCTCVAVKSTSQLGTITEAQLAPHLEGNSLAALIAQADKDPRLLVIDHTEIFEDYAPKIAALGDRYSYSGRAVLYRKNNEQWIPVGVELKGAKGEIDVYTPSDHPNYWLLARGTFTMLDVVYHQLITHWLRCHSVTEPFILAARRQLSELHPVHRLMGPHFRITLQINTNGRVRLGNSGGHLESIKNPGPFCMEFSAKVYEKEWRFNTQALPEDLIARGLAKKDPNTGEVKSLLKDYPYADDGLLLWNAIEKYVAKYLARYYDDSTAGKKVTEDVELMAWWKEILEVGHADLKEGWPELKNVSDLTRILSTMIWIGSGHHAAVNFSQYAFNSYSLNRPLTVTKPIPARGSKEYEALIKDQKAGERAYCDWLMRPKEILKGALIMEVLSFHSDDEVYMGDPNHTHILPTPGKRITPTSVTAAAVAELNAAVAADAPPININDSVLSNMTLVGGAMPIAVDKLNRALIAGAQYGQGRVALFGHEAAMSFANGSKVPPAVAKWTTAGAYADKSKTNVKYAVVAGSGNWFAAPKLAELDSRFTLATMPLVSTLAAGPAASGIDLLVLCSHSVGLTATDISNLVSYVANGGAILACGHNWVWASQNPKLSPYINFSVGNLFSKFGIIMRPQYAANAEAGKVPVSPAPSHLINAEAAAKALATKPAGLSAAEVAVAKAVLLDALDLPLGLLALAGLRGLLDSVTLAAVDEATKGAWEEILKKHEAVTTRWLTTGAGATTASPQSQAAVDPLDIYKEFCTDIKAMEALIKKRNADPTRKMRSPPGLPYTFLQPSSTPGISNRGVPQSVSI